MGILCKGTSNKSIKEGGIFWAKVLFSHTCIHSHVHTQIYLRIYMSVKAVSLSHSLVGGFAPRTIDQGLILEIMPQERKKKFREFSSSCADGLPLNITGD